MFYSNTLIFKRLSEIAQANLKNYPPFNIKKNSDSEYVIELALAGFTKNNITVEMQAGELKITGKSEPDTSSFFYKGIANRAFEKSFVLSDSIKIKNAYWANGMLRIVLESMIPEKESIKIEDEPEDFNSVR